MAKEIPLSQGKVAIVDDEDFEKLSAYKWCYSSTVGYAVSRHYVNGKKKALLMHRFLLNAPQDKITDHINQDKLDNRKVNLRLCSRAENNRNFPVVRANNKSGYKGVYLSTRGKWAVNIRFNKKSIYLGSFENKEDAARMYNFWAKDLFGEFANLNVIKEGE